MSVRIRVILTRIASANSADERGVDEGHAGGAREGVAYVGPRERVAVGRNVCDGVGVTEGVREGVFVAVSVASALAVRETIADRVADGENEGFALFVGEPLIDGDAPGDLEARGDAVGSREAFCETLTKEAVGSRVWREVAVAVRVSLAAPLLVAHALLAAESEAAADWVKDALGVLDAVEKLDGERDSNADADVEYSLELAALLDGEAELLEAADVVSLTDGVDVEALLAELAEDCVPVRENTAL